MQKIIDCITFFDNDYIFDFRYNILEKYVDKFVICESLFDHKNNSKKINFDPKKKYKNNQKIKHIILEDPFPKKNNEWQNQAIQREFILKNLDLANSEDLIFFSDPDEIPNPKLLRNFELKKKYGVFHQKFFNYKFNLFNPYESPWEGTKVCKKKNLKSIDFMRQKVRSKNLKYSFLRFDKEKNIQIFENAGWHFNNILSPEEISLKLRTYAHSEFADEKFSSIDIIKEKIKNRTDLFGRGHQYQKIKIDETYPDFLKKNQEKFRDFII